MSTLQRNISFLQKNITPDHIFKNYPWMIKKEQYMVTHNDYDGILTALILQSVLGWKLVGVYDLEKLYISESFEGSVRDIVFVDLDVTRMGFKSLGHHIIDYEEDSCNINQVFSITNKQYHEKYPLSTAVFLYWLYGIPLPNKKIAKLYLLHSDSAWKNYLDYTKNVTNWLQLLNMNDLLHILEHEKMKESIESYILPYMIGWNHQCSYTIKKGSPQFKRSKQDFQPFIDQIANIFELPSLNYPTDMKEKYSFKRETFKVNPNTFKQDLDTIKNKHKVFSYSLKYKDTVDITCF